MSTRNNDAAPTFFVPSITPKEPSVPNPAEKVVKPQKLFGSKPKNPSTPVSKSTDEREAELKARMEHTEYKRRTSDPAAAKPAAPPLKLFQVAAANPKQEVGPALSIAELREKAIKGELEEGETADVLSSEGAIKEWEGMMETGYVNAIACRAICHLHGSCGMKQDFVQARALFKQSAGMGCAESMHMYGVMCYKGEGGEKNLSTALQYWLNSADLGHPEACWRAGVLLWSGLENLPQDATKARKLIAKAADHGSLPAYEYNAICFRDGIGCKKDIGEAENWFFRFEEGMRLKARYPKRFERPFFKSDVNWMQKRKERAPRSSMGRADYY